MALTGPRSAIKSVVFDVGETLVDDSREWGAWADWIGVPRHTFSAVLGAVTAVGMDNAAVFEVFRPGFDVERERQRREAAGCGEKLDDSDLYPDVRPTLAALRAAGLWVGIAGNQTRRMAGLLRELNLPVDQVATSGEWGVTKPSKDFFNRVIDMASRSPAEILYVGDHRDYDVLAARAAGLRTALVRRGPWGHLWADDPQVKAAADWRIHTLTELPAALARDS